MQGREGEEKEHGVVHCVSLSEHSEEFTSKLSDTRALYL